MVGDEQTAEEAVGTTRINRTETLFQALHPSKANNDAPFIAARAPDSFSDIEGISFNDARQREAEGAPHSRRALYADFAAQLFDDALHDG